MTTLPFRATVFLRAVAGRPVSLIERAFAKEDDAVTWCQVMTEAQPQASGVWYVAFIESGRTMTLARQRGIDAAITAMSPEAMLPLLPGPVPDLSEAEVAHLNEEPDNPGESSGDIVNSEVVNAVAQLSGMQAVAVM